MFNRVLDTHVLRTEYFKKYLKAVIGSKLNNQLAVDLFTFTKEKFKTKTCSYCCEGSCFYKGSCFYNLKAFTF